MVELYEKGTADIKKRKNINQITEEVYQIFPRVSDNIPALMLYLIFSDYNNYIQPLAYLLIETESFYLLNNYHQKMMLFQNNEKKEKISNNRRS